MVVADCEERWNDDVISIGYFGIHLSLAHLATDNHNMERTTIVMMITQLLALLNVSNKEGYRFLGQLLFAS